MSHHKSPDRRQRRTSPARLVIVRGTGTKVEPPPTPRRWLRRTVAAWSAYWASDVASLARPQDHETALRLFELIDERARALRAYQKKPVLEGSRGQPVINPFAGFAVQLGREILALEKQLAITPRARIQLGVQAVEARKSLEELAREAVDDSDDPRGSTDGS